MNNKTEKEIDLDILALVEKLSSQVNQAMGQKTKSVFSRYPITFALLILAGVIIVSEGVKGILRDLGVLDINPWYLLFIGLVVLTITGTLYKKLDK